LAAASLPAPENNQEAMRIMPNFSSRIKTHLFGMFAIFFLITLPITVISFLQTPEYEVSSSILLRQGKRGSADLKTELAVLQGNVLTEQVLAVVGAEQLFPESGEGGRVRQFQQRLEAHLVRRSRIVEIRFRHPDPELAVKTVTTAVRLFGLELEKLDDPQSVLLEEELLLRRKQLQQAQNVLSMFRQNSRLHAPDGQMRHLSIERGRLEAVLAEESKRELELAGELDELRRQFAAVPVKAEASRNEFLKMKLYRHELLRKYDEKNPLITSVEEQLAKIRQQLQGGDALEALADWIVLANAAHSRQKEGKEVAQLQLSQLTDQQRQQVEQDDLFSSLEVEVDKSRELYAQQLNKVEENRKAGAKEGQVTVIEQPLLPLEPVSPKKLRNIVTAALFGLLCSLLYGFCRQQRRAGA
jgi:uncharacterized protein involved in exopolysaccharide biosynthesis